MIPKIIHYCWFGRNPLPQKAIKCIESWRKYLPDYEIKEWNEDNFDINICDYVAEAYVQKKYAFVSDFARFWVTYNYGGIYFDVDVEVIKDMSDILANGNFMGLENSGTPKNSKFRPAAGLGFGNEPKLPIIKELMDYYYTIHFDTLNLTIVDHTTNVLKKYGLQEKDQIQHIAGLTIYPSDYLCPINPSTGKLSITPNTVSIHHYVASWQPKKKKIKKAIKRLIGPKLTQLGISLKRVLYRKK